MARRRMFSLDVIDTDHFLDMPSSTQNLYFHLGMRADDEGFVSSPKRIAKNVNATEDDMRILIAKGFIIPFDSGVSVVTHWKMHNYIQNDRAKPTIYSVERSKVESVDGVYLLTNGCIQDVSMVDTQDRLGKVSSGKVRLEGDIVYHDDHGSALAYLNEKTGRGFKATKAHMAMIKARFAEGYTLDDFKTVVDKRVAKWGKDPKMAEYLRPSTLFCAKHFDEYLNDVTVMGHGSTLKVHQRTSQLDMAE